MCPSLMAAHPSTVTRATSLFMKPSLPVASLLFIVVLSVCGCGFPPLLWLLVCVLPGVHVHLHVERGSAHALYVLLLSCVIIFSSCFESY